MPTCNEVGCEVVTKGVCLNHFEDLKSCSHYSSEGEVASRQEDANIIDDENATDANPNDGGLKVHTGLSLLEEEINAISKDDYTRLIILAGMPEAGKTTALLCLMHQFQTQSNYRNYLFAGSKTLVDLEEKAWPSRTDSKNESAKTVRTNDMVPKFIHLKLAKQQQLEKKENLLFTDVSGELFKTLKDSTSESKKFVLANRADHFALFFDAGALSDPSQKFAARIAGLGILKSLTDVGVLLPKTRIQIVFSRWDLFESKSDKDRHRAFIETIQKEIHDKYSTKYSLSFHIIASRPYKSTLPFAFGIDELFDIWISKSQLDFNRELLEVIPQEEKNARHFLQYTFSK